MPKKSLGDDAAGYSFLHSNVGKIRLNISSVRFASPQVPQTKTYRKVESATKTDEILFRVWLALYVSVLNTGTICEDWSTRRISVNFRLTYSRTSRSCNHFLPLNK